MASTYNLLKDFVVPLVGPLVSLAVAVIFFWSVPNRQRKRALAVELWRTYSSDEMQKARRDAWIYLHGSKDPALVEDRVRSVWAWSMNSYAGTEVIADVAHLQQVTKIFNFFAGCERCLVGKEVDRQMLRALLGYFFTEWSEDTIEGVVKRRVPRDLLANSKRLPAWLDGMPSFRALCELRAPAPVG